MQWWLGRNKARPHTLLLEAGNLFISSAQMPTERPGEGVARAEVFLQVMHKMGYAAINVGIGELALGLEPLQRLAKQYKMPLLSANLLHQGKPVFAPTWVKDYGLVKVGVFGLITSTPPELGKWVANQGLNIADPVGSAKQAVAELRQQHCELIVLLSQLSRQEAQVVADQVPEITLILGSTGMEASTQLTAMGHGFFADAFTKGKYMGEILVSVRGDKTQFYAANLRSSLAAERADLASQVQGLQSQLETANKPGGPLQLTPETRQQMERQLAGVRAHLQRVSMELEGNIETPTSASTVELTMGSLDNEIVDDAWADAKVKKLQEKFPKQNGH